MTKQEIAEVTGIAAQSGIHRENTRLTKTVTGEHNEFDVMQASVEKDVAGKLIIHTQDRDVRLVRGDHSSELRRTCEYLRKASEHTENPLKKTYIAKLCRGFQTGDMETYKDSQKTWVHDHLTTVETMFGFVEQICPLKPPPLQLYHGAAEWGWPSLEDHAPDENCTSGASPGEADITV